MLSSKFFLIFVDYNIPLIYCLVASFSEGNFRMQITCHLRE